MTLSLTFALFLLCSLHTGTAMAGRAQRRQRQAEESLRPYIGRVEPEKLCELLKCHSPVGSWCQVVQENGVLIPKCVCPRSCPRFAYGHWLVQSGRGHQCAVFWEKPMGMSVCCIKKPAEGDAALDWLTQDHVWAKCTEEELGQFPYRLLDWFLLLSRMGESYAPGAPPQSCLSHTQRTQLAQQRFILLDKNKDGKLSHRDLRKLRYKRMPLEHCATPFFQSCDRNRNRKVTLQEWTTCLVDRAEAWFYSFMSVRMGSRKLCPKIKENNF